MKVNTDCRVPIKIWASIIEDAAIEQAKNLANLPFVFKHIALMPDAHLGYGMPIGGVMATKNVVVPNAVGKDIGCGMLSVRTSLTRIDLDDLKKIKKRIQKIVPVGKNHHKPARHGGSMPKLNREFLELLGDDSFNSIVASQMENATSQLGTLGGGNHFIEIQEGNDGHIYFMIHSGSRNLGSRVADFYNKVATDLNAAYYSSVNRKQELAFIPDTSIEYKRYMAEMEYCVEFALQNRLSIAKDIELAFLEIIPTVTFDEPLNIAHNYASIETHYENEVLVHRKGATRAEDGELGIIPGSQGTKSYIVMGKGNKESFKSCSHGAGRVLGRRAAQNTLNLDNEMNILDNQGILHDMKSQKKLEEAVGAYKSIDVVMRDQKDLVGIIVELSPLAVIKG